MINIKELQADVEENLAHAREIDATATRAEIHEAYEATLKAKTALSDGICDGANPCPDCGSKPHGISHKTAVRKHIMPIYEVGCLQCRDHRAQGFTPALAVESWNTGDWLPASDGPSVKV